MYYVYRIVNEVDDKCYVGVTKFPIEKRLQQHFRDSKRFPNRSLYKAINTFGKEKFSIELLEECDAETKSKKEIFWIDKFNSYINGYNDTYGGSGKSQIDVAAVMKLWKDGMTIKEIAHQLSFSEDGIGVVVGHYTNREDRIAHSRRVVAKAVKKIALSGEVLKEYSSIAEAALDTADAVVTHIVAVCKHKRKSHAGFRWEYI